MKNTEIGIEVHSKRHEIKDREQQNQLNQNPGGGNEKVSTSTEIDFSVQILQQPEQGRMSGLSATSSKRILDPPLVIRLNIKSIANKKPTEWQMRKVACRFICSIVLYHAESDEQIAFTSAIDSQTGYYNNLLGQTVQSCTFFDTPEVDRRTLFVFPDLAVRVQGSYRMMCSITFPESGQAVTVMAAPFEVSSPQQYVGVQEPTQLSKWLYYQGVSIRTGFHSKKFKEEILRKSIAIEEESLKSASKTKQSS